MTSASAPLILVVDDESDFLSSVTERIRLKGFRTLAASGGREALALARDNPLSMAIVDQRMPDMDGLVTIAKLREIRPGLKTVLLTGHGDEKLRQATEGLSSLYFEKDQMADFWEFLSGLATRPGMIIIPPGSRTEASGLNDLELLAARETMDRRQHGVMPEVPAPYAQDMSKIIGESAAVQELKSTLSKVAGLDCTVLLLGETGTGKELVARTIHASSPRNRKRFMAINCAAFTQDLLSNELFGHEKEAFTGARQGKQGVFEAASGGTILLDEVGDTPYPMQLQFLRVLQEKTVIRVGGTREIPVDVRVLAATNQDLREGIERGSFREDLYYRLNVFTLRIPPLRDRREDIPLLASFFLTKYTRAFDKTVEGISPEVQEAFQRYPFPGNVRELENVIERAVILCDGDAILPRHLPQRFRDHAPAKVFSRQDLVSLAELEKSYILEVVQATNHNKSEAAKILGINRASLWRKLKKYEEEG